MKKVFCLFAVFMSLTITALSQSYSGGSGTSGNPYLIATKADLKYLSENSSDWMWAFFKQTADISFDDADFQVGGDFYNGGSGFIPIGSGSMEFTGGYDGNGYKISNLKINRPSTDFVALFGRNAGSVEIKNLGIENADITGGNYTAGLVGFQYGSCKISNCYMTGSVSSSSQQVGGLVGHNEADCTISNCYSTGSVNGGSAVGGLVGESDGVISNCYATGSISGSSYIGGLVGENLGGTVSNSFWDTQTSGTSTGIGLGTSSGATGETTDNMKTANTFLNAGWDKNIWYMDSGVNNGYAYLYWQNPSGTPLPVELSSFSASVNLGTVILKWQTATEVNNQGFDIERSSSNNIFTKIGFVAGSGNSNSPKNYSFTDQPTGGTTFGYRLKQIDNNGNFKYYDPITVNLSFLTKPELLQNSPNPFNPSTSIKFYIPNNSDVSIKIFDILGREVTTLINKQAEAGYHIVYWNGKDRYGVSASSGIYLYSLTAGSFSETRKMLLMK
jgi:hypothetical protein